MRKVVVSKNVWNKIDELVQHLTDELKLSEELAFRKSTKMRKFIHSLSSPVSHPKCRFKLWCEAGYRCAVFEKTWIFAYEEFEEGIIVRDMKHTSLLKD